ncbi:hypothetical protein [Roseateles sp. BYS87W]|uniref:Uncharacterized protein n=1 Tax=Pelomonas baiyunensis TaxID=3299026 RepID=A0ABW7GXU2_9BURK
MKNETSNPRGNTVRWSANKRSFTIDLLPGMNLGDIKAMTQRAVDQADAQRAERRTAAMALASVRHCPVLVMALVARSIQRDDSLDQMCRLIGLRYGQLRLLVEGSHDVARQSPEFYRACATYLSCSTLSIELLAGRVEREDLVSPGSPDDQHWQTARETADGIALRALQTLADVNSRLPDPKVSCLPEWLSKAN